GRNAEGCIGRSKPTGCPNVRQPISPNPRTWREEDGIVRPPSKTRSSGLGLHERYPGSPRKEQRRVEAEMEEGLERRSRISNPRERAAHGWLRVPALIRNRSGRRANADTRFHGRKRRVPQESAGHAECRSD